MCATWVCSTFVIDIWDLNYWEILLNWVQNGREQALSISIIMWLMSVPHARSHLHSVGPHASFTVWSSYWHLHKNSSLLGTNVTIPDRNYKYASWHHFHYSQVWTPSIKPRNLRHDYIRKCNNFHPIKADVTNAKICGDGWKDCKVGWYSLDYMWRGDIYEHISHPPKGSNLTPCRFVTDSSKKQYRLCTKSLT